MNQCAIGTEIHLSRLLPCVRCSLNVRNNNQILGIEASFGQATLEILQGRTGEGKWTGQAHILHTALMSMHQRFLGWLVQLS